MPIHDWTRLEDGDFHHFHQTWIVYLTNALNGGVLPPGYMAMAEQVTGRPIPDVVTLKSRRPSAGFSGSGGLAVKDAPPTARVIARFEQQQYAKRANRVAIRHGRGRVVAILEIVSPGNKSSDHALSSFVRKAADIIDQGVHLMVVDLFPPSVRDPQGIHQAICEEIGEGPYQQPADKPLTVASYLAGEIPTAYVEPVGVGDALPSLALFLSEEEYVPAPLESTYQEAWDVYPEMLKEIMTSPENGS